MTQDELTNLESCKSEKEWNTVCDEVKAAHGGYPSDWYAKVVMSGLMARVAARFGRDDKIHESAL